MALLIVVACTLPTLCHATIRLQVSCNQSTQCATSTWFAAPAHIILLLTPSTYSLSGNHLTAESVRHLAELAVTTGELNRLVLHTVELPLDELTGRNAGSGTLAFEGSSLSPVDFVVIGECMKTNKTTHTLILRGVTMTDLTVPWIAGVLRADTALRKLTVSTAGLGDSGISALARAVGASRLVTFDFQGSRISSQAASALCDMLAESRTLRTLTLYANHLGDAGMGAMAATLSQQPNPVLRTLVVYNNDITETGAMAVAMMMRRNTTLTALSVVSNELGVEGCAALSEAAANNSTLVTLKY